MAKFLRRLAAVAVKMERRGRKAGKMRRGRRKKRRRLRSWMRKETSLLLLLLFPLGIFRETDD